jgi:hypothetical protein
MSFLLADDYEHVNPTTKGDDPLDGIEVDEETIAFVDALLNDTEDAS